MTLHPLAKKAFVLGSALLALGVLIGAFGAHGLKNMVEPEKLVTFETGVRYHFYHALALLFLGIAQQMFQQIKFTLPYWCFFLGVLFFSFNCYFYVVTGIKTFAMIVPVGGFMFIIGWIVTMVKFVRFK